MTRGGEGAASFPPFCLPGPDPGPSFLGFTQRREEGSARGRARVSRRGAEEAEAQRSRCPPPPPPRHCEARKGRGNPWTAGAAWGEGRPWVATPSARNDEEGGATNPRVQPRPAGGKPPAPQTAPDRVEQRAEPDAPVLGRATEGDSGSREGGVLHFLCLRGLG